MPASSRPASRSAPAPRVHHEPDSPASAGVAAWRRLASASAVMRSRMMRVLFRARWQQPEGLLPRARAPGRSPSAARGSGRRGQRFSRPACTSDEHDGHARADGGSSVPHRRACQPGLFRLEVQHGDEEATRRTACPRGRAGHVQLRRGGQPPGLHHAEPDDGAAEETSRQGSEDDHHGERQGEAERDANPQEEGLLRRSSLAPLTRPCRRRVR